MGSARSESIYPALSTRSCWRTIHIAPSHDRERLSFVIMLNHSRPRNADLCVSDLRMASAKDTNPPSNPKETKPIRGPWFTWQNPIAISSGTASMPPKLKVSSQVDTFKVTKQQ
mmetsp:Transcript_17512/g.48856  ORF Transcript_17512/g.48856 Transcript_17512/m.48856 type:complete len:114 (-) Transcript_17512:2726-3067(-)